VDLRQWLVDEFDDAVGRLKAHVLFLVPEEQRAERPGGGNSVLSTCYHTARHIDLALSVLTESEMLLPVPARRESAGLDEGEASLELDAAEVDRYLARVLVAARRYIGAFDVADAERVPDSEWTLVAAGLPADDYDWLYRSWSNKPVAFFVRWEIVGHLGAHVGEMIATVHRMGLSQY
jgi:hypothetical protein